MIKLIIEEDFRGIYSKVILKYFLAEGLSTKHSILIASQDANPANIVSSYFLLNGNLVKMVFTV